MSLGYLARIEVAGSPRKLAGHSLGWGAPERKRQWQEAAVAQAAWPAAGQGLPRCPWVSLAQQGTGSLASPLSCSGFLSFLSTEFGLTHTTDSIDNCPLQGDLTEPGTHSRKRSVGGKDNSHVTSTMEAPTPPKNILTLSSLTVFSLLPLGFKMMFFDPGKCGQGPMYPSPRYRLYSVQVWNGLGTSAVLS